MRLTGSFPLTAAVNKGARRIIGQIAPFGEVGYPSLGGVGIQLEIHPGGLLWDPENMPRLRSEHHTTPIGRAVTLDEADTGIIGAFSVSKTQAGTDALTLAADRLQAGLSVEVDVPDEFTPDADGVYRLTAEQPGQLTAAALVETPAFTSAQVHEVAAQKAPTMTDTAKAAEVTDDTLAEVAGTLSDIAGNLKALLPAGEDPAPATASSAPAKIPAINANIAVTREPFPYGHPGADGSSFFSDMVASRRGDSLAAQRVAKAEGMWRQLAAANEPVAQTDVTIPNVYQDAAMVNLPSFPRDIADNVPSTAITSARPILVPVVDAVTADGGSGEVVATHSEGTNPASGEVDIDYDTYTPGVYSGVFDINREALDAGSPGMDEILFGFLRRSYNNVTDTAAYTAIAGYSGIDTGSSTTDASNTVEAQNMVSTILAEMAAFKGRAGYPANIIWAAPSEFADVTSLNATDGRPIFPYVNPSNTVGQGSEAVYGDVYINGVRMINAPNVATTKVVVANTSSIHRWESPLLNFRWEEVAGPAKIRMVAFGYCLVSVLDARGVSLITQA